MKFLAKMNTSSLMLSGVAGLILPERRSRFTIRSPCSTSIVSPQIGLPMMTSLLQIAYAANILILVPVLFSMFRDGGGRSIRAFQGQVENSEGLRLLVASLWSAILVLSIAGLFQPRAFVSVLIMQVIYKLVYLLVYVLPRALRNGWQSIPLGISVSFLLIVIVWPFLISQGVTSL